MSQTEFIAFEGLYIESVATASGANPENVKVLSINEVSTRRLTHVRLLLTTAVSVQTSILLVGTQKAYIEDHSVEYQTALNRNLMNNGLPAGTLLIESTGTSVLGSNSTTPSPKNFDNSLASGNASKSNVPITTIVGAVVGFLIFIAGAVMIRRVMIKASPFQS